MKKTITLLCCLFLIFVVSACSSEPESAATMDDYIKAYEASGEDVNHIKADGTQEKGIDVNEKPMFQAISAKDGVIFNIETQVVKIYEYSDSKTLKDAKEANQLIKDWEANGKFLLETNSERAKEIFKEVK